MESIGPGFFEVGSIEILLLNIPWFTGFYKCWISELWRLSQQPPCWCGYLWLKWRFSLDPGALRRSTKKPSILRGGAFRSFQIISWKKKITQPMAKLESFGDYRFRKIILEFELWNSILWSLQLSENEQTPMAPWMEYLTYIQLPYS